MIVETRDRLLCEVVQMVGMFNERNVDYKFLPNCNIEVM